MKSRRLAFLSKQSLSNLFISSGMAFFVIEAAGY